VFSRNSSFSALASRMVVGSSGRLTINSSEHTNICSLVLRYHLHVMLAHVFHATLIVYPKLYRPAAYYFRSIYMCDGNLLSSLLKVLLLYFRGACDNPNLHFLKSIAFREVYLRQMIVPNHLVPLLRQNTLQIEVVKDLLRIWQRSCLYTAGAAARPRGHVHVYAEMKSQSTFWSPKS